jgi:hypothetical protein
VINLIKKAIEWLKLLFDWNNYIRTHQVFSYFITQNLNNIKNAVTNGQLQGWVNARFTALEGDITAAFASIQSIFEPTTTFNQFVPASASGSNPQLQGSPPLQAGPVTQQYQANGVQNGYVLSKTVAVLPSQLNPPSSTTQTEDPGQQLLAAFQSAFPTAELESQLKSLEEFGGQIDSLSSFFDVIVLALLDAAEDVVLFVVGAVNSFIDTVLSLAEQAIVSFLDGLTKKIDIPVISSLYKAIVGSELTLLDALCLCAAVPATIVYDIFYGQAPFPTDSGVAAFTSNAIQWPWQGQTDIVPAADGSEPAGAWTALLTLGIIVGFIYSATDISCDALNVASQAEAIEGEGTDPVVSAMSWIEVLAAILSWGLNGPWYSAADHPTTGPDRWDCSCWVLGCVPWLADLIFMDAAQGSLARFVHYFGPAITGCIGAAQLGVGIKTAVEIDGDPNYGAAAQASVILGSVSDVGKFFTYLAFAGPEAAIVSGVLLGLADLGGDLGSAITNFIPNSSGT